jgi:hypothetical protein
MIERRKIARIKISKRHRAKLITCVAGITLIFLNIWLCVHFLGAIK